MTLGPNDLDTQGLDQQSLAFTQRATSVLQQNSWMDHQTATVLAQAPTSDTQLHQQAQAVGDGLAQTWDGYEQAFFDPTLQAQPSTAQAVADYLHSTLGPPAVSSGSITQLQTALSKDGYLTPAQISGVWDSSSESAYNAAVNSYKTDVLSGGGGKPLTSKVSSMIHSLFHDASHPWDAASGWYDSVVQAVGDVAGAFAGTADDLIGGNGKALFNSVSQHTLNALTAGNTTAAAQEKYHQNPLNALGDITSVFGVTGLAKSAVKGAVVQGLKGDAAALTKQIAETEAKGSAATTTEEHLANIAKLEKIGATISGANKLGFLGNSINDIGDALRAGTLPSTDPLVQRKGLGIVSKTLLKTPGAALKAPDALVSSKWLSAVPGLSRLAPVTAKAAELGDWAGGLAPGADAFVYKARNLAAMPYRYAPVRAAGIAYSRAEIGSLAAHGVANLLPGSGLQQNIDRQNHGILDSLADAKIIPGLGVTPADLLTGGLLHGDLVGANTASKTVGKMVTDWTNGLSDKMGGLGVPAAFQTALGLSRNELVEQAGGDTGSLLTWMNSKIDDYASDTYATRQVAANFTGGKAEEVTALGAARDQWYKLPVEQRQQFVAALLKSDPHLQGLQTRIKADVLRNAVDPKAAVRASMAKYFDDMRDVQDLHASGALNYVVGPRGFSLLVKDAGTRSFGGDLEEAPTSIPPVSRKDYVSQGRMHQKAVQGGIDEILQDSYKRLATAQRKFDEARGLAKIRGAKIGLKHAQDSHNEALMAVGRTPKSVLDAAQKRVDAAAAALQEAHAARDQQFDLTHEHGDDMQIRAAETHLAAAKEHQASVKESRTNLNIAALSAHATGNPDTKREIARIAALRKHIADLHDHIKGGLLPEETDQEIRNIIGGKTRFDELYTRQYGPSQALPGDFGSGAHMAQINPENPGALGIQDVGNKTREEINDDAEKFAQKLVATDALKKGFGRSEAVQAVAEEMKTYLHEQFNMDASHLGVFDDRAPEQLITQIQKLAESRPSEVLPTWDQPTWVTDRIAALRARGKRLVFGSHIGHSYDGTLPQFTTLEGFKTPIRKWAGKVGLDPQRIPDVEVAKSISHSKDANIHDFLTNDPQARLATPHADFRTARAALEAATGKSEMNPILSAALSLTSRFGLNKTAIDQIVKDAGIDANGKPLLSRAEAEGQLKAAIGGQFGIRDLAKKKLVDHLMTTQEIPTADGSFTWHAVDRHTATGIVNAAVNAYRQPSYMMGLEQIENFARSATYGFGDKLVARAPDSKLYNLVNAWPSKILNARNQLRFTVSPLFAARVATKVRFKAALEGVQIPFNPLHDLVKSGDDVKAKNLLDRMGGKVPTEQMDADRYAVSRDIFGIHDSSWDAAYFVHAQTAKGLSPDEVKASYERVFKYGAGGGRSAAERTANTLFFPFSFEKTLLRNTGAYLLDHPTQAMILDNAVEQWRVLDRDQRVGRFIDAHLPILQELQLLNGFAHGISPGQFGGINAPIIGAALKLGSTASASASSGKSEALLNLLMPHAWGSNFTVKNLEKYMPIWKQAGALFKSVNEQKNIGFAAWHDTYSKIIGSNAKPEPTLTPFAQVQAALSKKASLINDPAVRSVIDYNARQSDDADKYRWPQNAKLPQSIWNQPVDRTTISAYMQYLYPAYNPQKSADFAVANKTAQAAFIQNIAQSNPAKAAQLTAFSKLADQVIGHLNADSYDTATAQQVQSEFHDAAQKLSTTDPTWLKFYDTYYKAALGPIQSYDGKAAA